MATWARGDTSKFAQFVLRIMRAYGRRVASADEADVVEMIEMLSFAEAITAKAIGDYLALDLGTPRNQRTRTWRALARRSGVSEQAFRQKWLPKIEKVR